MQFRLCIKSCVRTLVPRTIRNWMRAPRTSGKWAWDEVKHFVGRDYLIEMRPGWHLRCHPTAYDFAYHLQNSDPDQIIEFDGFISVCEPKMVLLDVGAHFGLFSLAAIYFGGPKAKAIAVDPSPTATRMLEIQLRLNGLTDRVTVVQGSISDSNGWQELVTTGVNGAGFFLPPDGHTGREITRSKTMTLDSLTNELKIAPTHVKIDVEGGEAAVLRGGQNLLSKNNAPILLLELHNEIIRNHQGDPTEALTLLKEAKYTCFSPDMLPVSDDYILSKPLVRVIARKRS